MAGVTLRQFFDASQKEDDEVVGWVVDNMDPLKLGRIRVRIPGFTDNEANIPTDFLPWMNMKRNAGTGTSKGVEFAVPALDTKVLVKRTTQDDYQWTVTNELMTSNHDQLGLYQGNYPMVHGKSDADNTYTTIDMLAKRLFFHHTSGTTAEILASGTTNISIRDDLNVQVDDNGWWNYNGNLTNTIKEWRFTTVFLDDTLLVKQNKIDAISLSRTSTVGTSESMSCGTFRSSVVGTNDDTYVGGYSNHEIVGHDSRKVGGYQTLDLEGSQAEAIKGTRDIVIEDNDTLTVNGEITITSNGGQLTIVSTGDIHIAANDSINMTAGKSINCSAPVINLDS